MKQESGIKVRKNTVIGVVVSDRMHKTVTIRTERRVFLKKYGRFTKRYYKVKAHNPDNIAAQEGDVVIVAESRPLSKSKHFVVISKKE